MENYLFDTHGVCAKQIQFKLDGDTVHDVKFFGGCDGNLKAIPILVEGMTVDEVYDKLKDVKCGMKKTSCAAQLAQSLKTALEYQNDPENAKQQPTIEEMK